MAEFKDTMMGKMTINAIKSWGENDEQGNWYAPTQEQAEKMVSGEGPYATAEKATNNKTYGSEIAAINGLAERVAAKENLNPEQKEKFVQKLKEEVYSKEMLSNEMQGRIQSAMGEGKDLDKAVVDVLGTIHDNWVKDNGKKFDAPGREKKLYQFTDLRMMSYGGDGATADLLFLRPILEGAGIEIDDASLEQTFNEMQKSYLADHDIHDKEGLTNYFKNIATNYPALVGVRKGKTEADALIVDELQNPEVQSRMVEQVDGKVSKNYEEKNMDAKVSISDIEKVSKEKFKSEGEKAVVQAIAKDRDEKINDAKDFEDSQK